jgi:hypothetical protein
MLTIYLSPAYKAGLKGKHIIVLDDCTTYGVSFGVATAFLRKAGAASVTGIALGKFGNRLDYLNIEISSDPFAPIPAGKVKLKSSTSFPRTTDSASQRSLVALIP